jgi:hypothetical protein
VAIHPAQLEADIAPTGTNQLSQPPISARAAPAMLARRPALCDELSVSARKQSTCRACPVITAIAATMIGAICAGPSGTAACQRLQPQRIAHFAGAERGHAGGIVRLARIGTDPVDIGAGQPGTGQSAVGCIGQMKHEYGPPVLRPMSDMRCR